MAKAECFNPADKDMILETVREELELDIDAEGTPMDYVSTQQPPLTLQVRQHHGSVDAFDAKLKLQVGKSACNVW